MRIRATAKKIFIFTSYLNRTLSFSMVKLSITVALGTAKCPRSVWKLSSGFVAHSWQYFSQWCQILFWEWNWILDRQSIFRVKPDIYYNRYSAIFSMEYRCWFSLVCKLPTWRGAVSTQPMWLSLITEAMKRSMMKREVSKSLLSKSKFVSPKFFIYDCKESNEVISVNQLRYWRNCVAHHGKMTLD